MKKRALLYSFVIIVAKFFFKAFYRHKIYGLEHFPEGSALVAPNHVSYLDPPCIAVSCPGEIHFLARDTLFKSFFGKLIKALNAHPVKKNASNLQAMKEICSLLTQGHKVLMFPEGTRSKNNKILDIKPGIGLLLSKSKSVIIPAYIHGTFNVWSRKQKFPKPWGQTAVVFGSPIRWEDYKGIDRKEVQSAIAHQLAHSLITLRKWYDEGHKGLPP